MGCFLGLFTTFEILECIRVADTTEPFFVFGRNTSVFVAFTWQLKIYCNTVLLLYIWERLFAIDRGIVYILEQMFDYQEGHICSIHKPIVKSTFPRHFTSNTTSIPTSTKPNKIKYFITFNTIKNHHYSTLKSPQTLINKAFSRTPPKTLYLIKK